MSEHVPAPLGGSRGDFARAHAELASVFDAASLPMVLLTADDVVLAWNHAAERLFGWSAEEVVGGPLPHVPPDLRIEREGLRRAVEGGERIVGVLTERLRKDGTRVTVSMSSGPVLDRDGRVVGYLGTYDDVTALVQVREELRRRAEQFSALAENSPDIIARIDRAGRHLYVNRAVERATGLPREAFLGRTNEELGMPAAQAEYWREARERTFATGVPQVQEFSFPSPDGERFYQSWLVPERGAAGEVETLLGVTRDVTERVRAEQALRESELRFRLIAESSHDMLAVHAPDFRYTYVSPASLTLLGFDPGELVGQVPFDLAHPDDRPAMERAYRQAVDALIPPRVSYRMRHRDGHWVWVEAVTYARRAADGHVEAIYCTVRDVTERRKSEEDVRRRVRMEVAATLAAGIAHQLNNLMTSVLGNAALLRDGRPSGAELAELADEITRAAQRAGELSRQLLAHAGVATVLPAQVDLNKVVREGVGLQQHRIPAGVEVVLELAEGLPPLVADEGQLAQVLANLVANAVEAMGPAGRLTVRTARKPAPGAPGAVVLVVSDTGHGMPPEVQARVFEPFFSTRFPGRGLGLAAAYGIVQGLGGSITVQSEVDRGSTFEVVLPAAPPSDP